MKKFYTFFLVPLMLILLSVSGWAKYAFSHEAQNIFLSQESDNLKFISDYWTKTTSPPGTSVYNIFCKDNFILAGGCYTSCGGILKSTDKGDSWVKIFNGFPNSSPTCFATNGSAIFSAAVSGGIYRSDDNGETWTSTGFSNGNYTVKSLYYSVTLSTWFAGVVYNDATTLYKSTDDGLTWTGTDTGLPNGYGTDVTGIAFYNNILYVSTSEYKIFKSTNNGNSFSAVDNCNWTWTYGLAQDNSGIVYANTGNGIHKLNTQNGYFIGIGLGGNVKQFGFSTYNQLFACSQNLDYCSRSLNRDGNFHALNSGIGSSGLLSLGFDNNNNVYAGGLDGFYRNSYPSEIYLKLENPIGGEALLAGSSYNIKWTSVGISQLSINYTTNNGSAWIAVAAGVNAANGSFSWTVPNTPSKNCLIKINDAMVYNGANVVSRLGYNFEIFNGGPVWTTTGFSQTPAVNTLFATDDFIFAGITGKLYRSHNNGNSWQQLTLPVVLAGKPFQNMLMNNGTLFVYQAPYVFKSTDFGSTWTYFTIPGGDGYYFAITSAGTFFCGNTFGTYKSTNNGLNWAMVPGYLGPNNTQQLLEKSNGNLLFIVGASMLWECTSDGTFIQDFNKLANFGSRINNVIRTASGNYLATKLDGSIYRSTDECLNWTKVTAGLIHNGNNAKVFRNSTGDIFAIFANAPGVYKSTDDGLNWEHINQGLPADGYGLSFLEFSSQGVAFGSHSIQGIYKTSLSTTTNLLVTYPYYGLYFTAGNNFTITWTGNNLSTLKIEYTTNNGNSWNLIANNVNSSGGSYSWLVQNTPSVNCRIRITDNTNTSYQSVSGRFTIQPQLLPDKVTLSSPSDGQNNITLTPTFQWNSAARATTYNFYLSSTPEPDNIFYQQNGLTGTDHVLPSGNLSFGQTYYWFVSAQNSYGEGQYSDPWSFTTMQPLPDIPVPDYPADSATGVPLTPTFHWNAAARATEYFLQISFTNDFLNVVYSDSNLTGTYKDIPAGILLNNTNYYYRLKSINQYGSSNWSVIRLFTTSASGNGSLPIPVLGYPRGGQLVYSLTPTVSWYINASINDFINYEIQVSSVLNDVANFNVTIKNIPRSKIDWVLHSLYAGRTYYWRMRTTGSNNSYSAYTNIDSFKTDNSLGPVTPIPSWPHSEGIVYTLTPELKWYLPTTPPSPLKYKVKFGTDPNLTGSAEITDINELQITLPKLNANTAYYWAVCSYSGTTSSDFSPIQKFYTQANLAVVVPIASWPRMGAMVYTNSPTLSWYLPSNAINLTYRVKYSTDPNNVIGAQIVDNINALQVVLNNLTAGQTYYWQVCSFDGSLYSDYSSPVESFVVQGQVGPEIPVASWPRDNNILYMNNTRFDWYMPTSSQGITSYSIQYSLDAGFGSSVTINNITEQYKYVTGLLPGTTYYWRVKAYKGALVSDWSVTAVFKTENIAGGSGSTGPTPVAAGWPRGGATEYTNSPTLKWYLTNSHVGVVSFLLKLSVNPNMSGAQSFVYPATQFEAVMSNLTYGQTYYWTIQSFDGTTYSTFDPPESFVIYVPQSLSATSYLCIPSPVVPMAGNKVYDNSIELSWKTNTASSVTSFDLEYSFSPDFQGALLINDINRTSYKLSNLISNITYYWRVRSKGNGLFVSDNSITGYFTTDAVTKTNENVQNINKFDLKQNYPNPFNPSTAITYQVPALSKITLKIYDLLGNLITTLVDETKEKGQYTINWNASNYSSGIYYYELKSGDLSLIKKMVLIK